MTKEGEPMESYEKLGVFYLGRAYDLAKKSVSDELILYDSRDLLTHAFCVGMTGSGKTGLCIALLEEAAIDGIPSIVIDPKGDLANLMLTFPGLSAPDFRPWINEDAASRDGVSPEAYAASQADLWRNGLATWGQSGERIERLRNAADFVIYTPGSEAGLPVSILGAFTAPSSEILGDKDLLNERVTTTATSLLGLLGIDADPIRSREHILIATILEYAWEKGQDLDLASLIHAIQSPPISRVGVLELESFYPSKERFELATALNNLLASPGFETWLSGDPLDVDRLLYTEKGKPRVAIFYIAHLSDTERMFFVSLLFNQILGWVRTRPGTTSLRALVYMDEVFGFIPPVAEPPSKRPLLTLLKQARAYGVGVVLATQNPVDLDYKALSNIGTWFIGRLQTDRDRERLLDGLEGVTAGRAGAMSRQKMEETISALDKRVFLMHDIHENEPVVFQTRWAMSYLCGPLTRQQIKTLTEPVRAAGRAGEAPGGIDQRRAGEPADRTPSGGPARAAASRSPSGSARVPAFGSSSASPAASVTPRPVLPPDVSEAFLPLRGSLENTALVYQPGLLAIANVRFVQARSGPEHTETVTVWSPLEEGVETVDWEKARPAVLAADDLQRQPAAGAEYGALSSRAMSAKNFAGWRRMLSDTLYRTRSVELLWSPRLKLASQPGENEREFRIRLGDTGREDRDYQVERLRKKHAAKFTALEDRIRRAEAAVERERGQAKQEQVQTAISFGATMLEAFLGRKRLGRSTLGRATTTARGVGRSAKQAQDIGRAEAQVQSLRQQLADLQAEFDAEAAKLGGRLDPEMEELEKLVLRPRKIDIDVKLLTLAWGPYRKTQDGSLASLWE